MIPTIEDIVAGLIEGTTTREDTVKWLNEHCRLSYSGGYDGGYTEGQAGQ